MEFRLLRKKCFVRPVAQFMKHLSAFLLRPFFLTLLFPMNQLRCCAVCGIQTASEKMFCEACCAVSEAPLSFSAKAYFLDPIVFNQAVAQNVEFRLLQKKSFVRPVAQSLKHLSAFILRPFFLTLLFAAKQLRRLWNSDYFRKKVLLGLLRSL